MMVRLLCWIGVFAMAALALTAWRSVPREQVIASFATPLGGRTFSQRHNALLAARGIDGKVLLAGAVLSFNAAVGSYSRDQGFRKAPVSFNGQLIDDWGGGVCQTSTTFYNAALLAGLSIVERNHHRFCPSYVAPGRDAAVAFPSLDLKVQNLYSFPVRIHAQVDADVVRVDLLASHTLPNPVSLETRVDQKVQPTTYVIGGHPGRRILRNSGKAGYTTRVFRLIGGREELVSDDSYPVMNRLIEYR
jgi:vancomycin resistance protein VanW